MSALLKSLVSSITLCALSIVSSAYSQTSCGVSALATARGAARVNNESLTPAERTSQAIFDFHSGFWVNLHHFLYQEALDQKRALVGGGARAATNAAQSTGLTPDQQRIWQKALDYYRKAVIERDLLFDDGLVNTNRRLGELEKAGTLKDSGLNAEFVSAIEGAAPVYRARWWAGHDAANRKWIAGIAPLVQRLGPTLVKRLTAAYQTKWPDGRMRVEVSAYANWAGAYTALNPTLVTISSLDPGNQNLMALEIVFHEASHALVGPVRRALEQKLRAQNKEVPRDLWHVLLFYTTGEIVKRALFEDGHKDFKPYADAGGMYARIPKWAGYRQVFEREWLPYIDGKVDYETALARVVSAL